MEGDADKTEGLQLQHCRVMYVDDFIKTSISIYGLNSTMSFDLFIILKHYNIKLKAVIALFLPLAR